MDTVKFSALKTGRSKRRKSRWRNGSLPYKGKRKKDREKKRKIEKLSNLSNNSVIIKNLLKDESDLNSPEKNNQLTIDSLEKIPNAFKGFQNNSEEELNNMTVIYNILDELISKIEENTIDSKENNTLDASIDNEDIKNYLESNLTENTFDETNNRINEETSKFDKEEKIEKIPDKDLKNDEVGLDKWLNVLSKKKEDDDEENEHNNSSSSSNKLALKEKKQKDSKDDEEPTNDESDNEISLIEMRDTLLNEASFDEFSHVIQNTIKEYNLQNIKFTENESWNVAANNFNEFITDLSASNFKLIADSVETLRNLIKNFSSKDNLMEINKDVSISKKNGKSNF